MRLCVRPSARLIAVLTTLAVFLTIGWSILPDLASGELQAPTQSPVPPPAMPFTDVSPYGANFFLEWEPEEWKIEKTFEMAHDAGIKWVKQHFPWESLQLTPGPNGYWNERLNQSTWDKYDLIVRLAHKYDLEVIARLDRPPAWTRSDNRRPERPPDSLSAYGDFVYDVVKHFRGRIHYYQIWNEPNIYPEWGEQSPDPAAYVALLKIAYQRAKEADPNVVILSAPLAQTTDESSRNMSDVRFLTGMYAAGARDYFDILFANAYGFAEPPTDPPAEDRLNFQRVVLLRQIMEKNGDADKPIWFNEFGWNAAPEDFEGELPWARVTEQQQAQYTVEAIRYARTHWPWAGVFNIWYFRQPGASNIPESRADYYFRMVDPGFTPRLVYNAVKQVASGPAEASPGTYAMTDPSVARTGNWEMQLNPAGVGGVMFASNTPGDSATIAFRGGSLSLRVQRSPNAGQVFVTIDGREANALDDHVQGRSVLNLNGSDREGPVNVPIVDGLGVGRHVMRLVVGPAPGQIHGPVTLAGFEINPVNRLAPLWSAGRRALVVLAIGAVAFLTTLLWPRRNGE